MNLTKESLRESLKKIGLDSGSVVMMHSDALFLAQIEGETIEKKIELFIDVVLEIIGPFGTFIVPTFTYSLTQNEVFDFRATPSKVGIFSEYFRKLPKVTRTSDPIFSVSSIGFYSKEISKLPYNDSFGEDSIFGFLRSKNALLICIGCSFDRITFTHYVEQKLNVNYRFKKNFYGKIILDNTLVDVSVNYFVRDLNRDSDINLNCLYEYMLQNKLLTVGTIGRIASISTNCIDFENSISQLIKLNSNVLIQEYFKKK